MLTLSPGERAGVRADVIPEFMSYLMSPGSHPVTH